MSKKLYVGNLPYTVDSGQLSELFSKYGENQADVIFDRINKNRSKGFGFVTFTEDSAADAAMEMNGQDIEGRKLVVNEARESTGGSRGPRDNGGSRGGNGGGYNRGGYGNSY